MVALMNHSFKSTYRIVHRQFITPPKYLPTKSATTIFKWKSAKYIVLYTVSQDIHQAKPPEHKYMYMYMYIRTLQLPLMHTWTYIHIHVHTNSITCMYAVSKEKKTARHVNFTWAFCGWEQTDLQNSYITVRGIQWMLCRCDNKCHITILTGRRGEVQFFPHDPWH